MRSVCFPSRIKAIGTTIKNMRIIILKKWRIPNVRLPVPWPRSSSGPTSTVCARKNNNSKRDKKWKIRERHHRRINPVLFFCLPNFPQNRWTSHVKRTWKLVLKKGYRRRFRRVCVNQETSWAPNHRIRTIPPMAEWVNQH
jgi:hypothetical protein